MTLAKRISIVRTLTIIQMVVPLCFFAIGFAFFGLLALGNVQELPPLFVIALAGLLCVVALAVTVGLPWIVLHALRVRKEQWATAALVSLVVQIVAGGGFFSILPIISFVLLLDTEASAYLGMK